MTRGTTYALLMVLAAAGNADAQWLRHPTRGIPRTASGEVDLTAAAPVSRYARRNGYAVR